jgi:hypothetical protein
LLGSLVEWSFVHFWAAFIIELPFFEYRSHCWHLGTL